MNERQILINNLKINYKIAGEGPAILILHGWGGSSDSWIEVQWALADKGYKVIAPDFPGFGKSETPPAPWTLNDYLNWTINFINSQKLDKFFLISHSFGGRIAIKLSPILNDKIKALVLCNPAGIKIKPKLKSQIIIFLAVIGDLIFSIKPLQIFKDFVRNIFLILIKNRDYAKANKIMRETMKNVLKEDLLLEISEIKNKTLIVWGEEDKILPVPCAFLFNDRIKDSRLEIIPEVGHSPHLEAPEILVQKILSFID